MLLVFVISVKDLKVDFFLIEFEFQSFERNCDVFVFRGYAAVIVLDIGYLLICHF